MYVTMLASLAFLADALRADVKLPAILGDNMALQAGKPLAIWGTAEPAEKVTVTLAGQTESTSAGPDGKWQVALKPLAPGGPFEMTVAGHNTLRVKNVVVGRVWVCSGQSNMYIHLDWPTFGKTEVPKANYPKLRLFEVAMKRALAPQDDCQGAWVECTPKTAPQISAVGFFFGRELHTTTNEPVGIIASSVGATAIQSWLSVEGFEKEPALESYAKLIRQRRADLPALKAKQEQETPAYLAALKTWQEEHGAKADAQLKAWSEAVKAAKAAGIPEPPRPQYTPAKPLPPAAPEQGVSGTLYNGMIAPLTHHAIEGILWYQGETNAGNAPEYRILFPRLIQDWREKWGEGDLPFLFVQLANFKARQAQPGESAWAALREAQASALKLPKTGMAVAIDLGDPGEPLNIHPRDKLNVARRLMRAAERVVFDKQVALSPTYDTMKIEGDKIRLAFKDIGSGLAIGVPPATQPDQKRAAPDEQLKGFAIAGDDHKWVWAQAKIEGDSVIVWSENVPHPVAVRYGWADNPDCNLYNKEGLAAVPFRTDDWPGVK